MNKLSKTTIAALVVLSAVANAGETTLIKENQKDVALTIYNENLSLVKDVREINKLNEYLIWKDVSSKIINDSTQLRDLNRHSFNLLSQNFDFDLLSPGKLLEKHIGKKVTVIRTNPGNGLETKEDAIVLSTNGGIVLKYQDRVETGVNGRFLFSEIPQSLKDKPTLTLQIEVIKDSPSLLELSYLTKGLGWYASYVANLSEDEKNLQLNGWITLKNTSGTDYKNAKLQLVAGDINQVESSPAPLLMAKRAMISAPDMSVNEAKQENLSDYHLYTIPRKVDIADNQIKQLALLSSPSVRVNKKYVMRGQEYHYQNPTLQHEEKLKIDSILELENAKDFGLGTPLPKGIFRVYKKDSNGNAQFIGEDSINHTPINEKLSLKLGSAFDLTSTKKQISLDRVKWRGEKYTEIWDSGYEIIIKNAKKEPVEINIIEQIPGDWEMLSENVKHKRESNMAIWKIRVPAEGSYKLNYKIRMKI